MVLGKLPVPGVLLIWIKAGQGRVVVVWTFFLSSIISLFFLSLSGGDGPLYTLKYYLKGP